MTEYWIPILGGLIGSILTVVISKILEILQKSKEHKYTLQKLFFEKKLLAAEATITQYTIISEALINLSVLFERINENTDDGENSLHDILNKNIMQQLEVANNASLIVANSVTLYFDLDNKFNQNEIISDFYKLLGSMQTLQDKRDLLKDLYDRAVGTPSQGHAYQLFLQSNQDVNMVLKSISATYSAFNTQLMNVIKQIRDEMRKYDY